MKARTVLFLAVSLCSSSVLNVADGSEDGRVFERLYDISRLIFNVPGGEVCSLVDCGGLCAKSSSCKAFCYSQSTALCHLSRSYDPIVQQYDVSDSTCYNAIGCPITKGYAWYGARCIKGYGQGKNYTDARAICTQDGGHLYHFKDLEWDLQPILDLRTAVGNLNGRLWMGADDLEVQGQFKWSDSSLLANDSPVWKPGEPNYPAERCVGLTSDILQLFDAECHRSFAFVCQMDI